MTHSIFNTLGAAFQITTFQSNAFAAPKKPETAVTPKAEIIPQPKPLPCRPEGYRHALRQRAAAV